MSKSVLMSFSPYWYVLIAEGIKTEEVRKSIPKALDWNGQIECYMTKDEKSFKRIPKELQEKYRAHMGKVGMRFTCDQIHTRPANTIYMSDAQQIYLGLLNLACLTELEAIDYMGGQLNRDMYFFHISDLVIYDKPRELGEFRQECDGKCLITSKKIACVKVKDKRLDIWANCDRTLPLSRPPASWCYVEEV